MGLFYEPAIILESFNLTNHGSDNLSIARGRARRPVPMNIGIVLRRRYSKAGIRCYLTQTSGLKLKFIAIRYQTRTLSFME